MLRALFHFLIRQSESQSDKRSCKSTYDSGKKSKIRLVSRVITATKSELKESERFHFLPAPLMTSSLTI